MKKAWIIYKKITCVKLVLPMFIIGIIVFFVMLNDVIDGMNFASGYVDGYWYKFFIVVGQVGLLLFAYSMIIAVYKRKHTDLLYMVSLNKTEERWFWLFCFLPWITIGNLYAGIFFFLFFSFDFFYAVIWEVFLFSVSSMMIHYVKEKKQRITKRFLSMDFQNPTLNTIKRNLVVRLRNTRFLVAWLLILSMCILPLLFVSHIVKLLYMFAVAFCVTSIEDMYWIEKSNALNYYRMCAVPFRSFYLFECISSIILWLTPIFFFTLGFFTVGQMLVYFLLFVLFIIYWENVYLYLSQVVQDSMGVRTGLSAVFICLIMIPIANVCVYILLLKKNRRIWEEYDIS